MYYLVYKSLSKKSLYSYKDFLEINLNKFVNDFTIIPLPKKKRKVVLLKSPHVNKKAKEAFEIVYYKFMIILNLDLKNLQIIRSNVPNLLHLKCFIKN
jgi:ribosomal protein S10